MGEFAKLFIDRIELRRESELWQLKTQGRERGRRLNRVIAVASIPVIRNGEWTISDPPRAIPRRRPGR